MRMRAFLTLSLAISTCICSMPFTTTAAYSQGAGLLARINERRQARALQQQALGQVRAGNSIQSDLPADVRPYFDIAYGSDKLQKLDLFAPASPKTNRMPVVFFVHGGGWRMGDKLQHGKRSAAYTRHGVIFVSVNYRLAPTVHHPDQIQDIAKAFAWLKANATRYGGDPGRIYVMGHSAGAHLVDLLATNDTYLKDVSCSLADIKGVISLDTASLNLTTKVQGLSQEDKMVGGMIRAAFGSDPRVLAEASPTLNLVPGKAYPPFLLYCGSSRIAALREQELFSQAAKKVGASVVVRSLPNTHREIGANALDESTPQFAEIMQFISQH
jgi:arylformamidase